MVKQNILLRVIENHGKNFYNFYKAWYSTSNFFQKKMNRKYRTIIKCYEKIKELQIKELYKLNTIHTKKFSSKVLKKILFKNNNKIVFLTLTSKSYQLKAFQFVKLDAHQSLSSFLDEIKQPSILKDTCNCLFIGKTKLSIPFTKKIGSPAFVYDESGKFFIFGGNIGISGSRWMTSDLQFFSLNNLSHWKLFYEGNYSESPVSLQWEKIKTQESPLKRNSHSFTTISNKLILLYGGRGLKGNLSDMWELIDNRYWKEIPHDQSNSEHPGPRRLHQSAVWHRLEMESNEIYPTLIVYGGINQYGQTLNDLWLFDYFNKSWTTVEINEKINILLKNASQFTPLLGLWRDKLLLCSWKDMKDRYDVIIYSIDLYTKSQSYDLFIINKMIESRLAHTYHAIIIGSQWYFFFIPFDALSYCYVFDLLTKTWTTQKIDWNGSLYTRKNSFHFYYIQKFRRVLALSDDLDFYLFSSKQFYKSWTWETRYLALWLRTLAYQNTWIRTVPSDKFEWCDFFKELPHDIFYCILNFL